MKFENSINRRLYFSFVLLFRSLLLFLLFLAISFSLGAVSRPLYAGLAYGGERDTAMQSPANDEHVFSHSQTRESDSRGERVEHKAGPRNDVAQLIADLISSLLFSIANTSSTTNFLQTIRYGEKKVFRKTFRSRKSIRENYS